MSDSEEVTRRLRQVPVVAEAFELLATKLPAGLPYHTVAHTEDVFREVLYFAQRDGLQHEALELLAIGAAYHDTGFINAADENEEFGASLAIEAMSRTARYSQQQRAAVRTMIVDTTLRSTPAGPCQVPTTELSKYLCDADVSNLGRADFFEKAELKWREIGSPPKREFLQGVARFLASHRWHTPAATALRQAQKEKNVQELQNLLRSMS